MRPYNFIDPSVRLGKDVKVWHFAVVLSDVVIGDDASIGSFVEIGRSSVIGSGSRIGSHTFLPTNSQIGQNVFIGPNVTFTDDRYPVVNNPSYHAEPPVVDDFASIGAGSVILPGVRIGRQATIGAGSVVTKDVPDFCKVYGPAATTRPSPCRDATHNLFSPILGDESPLDNPALAEGSER